MFSFDELFNWYNFFNYPFYFGTYKLPTNTDKSESTDLNKSSSTTSKLSVSKNVNNDVSDIIHSYIKDGYKLDPQESIIDKEKDKDCTFKAVLNKDVDGAKHKTTITMSETNDNGIKCSTYRKVDLINGAACKGETKKSTSPANEPTFKSLDDYVKVGDKKKKVRRWKCVTPHKDTKQENVTTAPNNVYTNRVSEIDELVNKIRSNIDASICSGFSTKSNQSDEVEDSLVTMVRRIFGL